MGDGDADWGGRLYGLATREELGWGSNRFLDM